MGTALTAAAVLGAACWIGRWAVDGTASDAVSDGLFWVGAALLVLLAVGIGTLMVRPVPLKAVVGPCLGLLAVSLGAVLGLDGEPVRAGIVGLVLLVVAPVAWERTRPLPGNPARADKVKPQRAGSHAR